MENVKFKVGDYLRILPHADLGNSSFSHGDVLKVTNVMYDAHMGNVYYFNNIHVGFLYREVELAEDFILKEIWSN